MRWCDGASNDAQRVCVVVGTDNRSGRGAGANGVDMIPNDCGALVRLQGPYPQPRTRLRGWVLLGAVIGACIVAVYGCASHQATPMAEYQCAGWRTVNGANECLQVERTTP